MAKAFSKEQLDYLDGIFVRKDDCNERHEKADKEFTEINIQLAKMSTQLGIIVKVCAFIAGGIGTILIGAVGSLIIK